MQQNRRIGVARGLVLAVMIGVSFLLGRSTRAPEEQAFAGDAAGPAERADLNSDGSTDVSDAVFLLRFLFDGGPAPSPCDTGPVVGEPVTTVILTRHAEKESGEDPSLSMEGQLRAEQFATLLANVEADTLITSRLRRTIETLLPLAEARGKTESDLVQLETAQEVINFIGELPPGSTAVIAHHSFTLPSILTDLGVTGHEDIPIGGTSYENWFLVQIPTGSPPQLHHFRYAPLTSAKVP